MSRSEPRQIRVVNARTNNLKSICLDIPHGQWLSICGVSGSGKSSLALDTLYAEGQRRYAECLSVKTRQFLQQMEKPDADHIVGVPPAIAVGSTAISNLQLNLAESTELSYLLTDLFSHAAIAVCPDCQLESKPQTPQSIFGEIKQLPANTKCQIGYPLVPSDSAPDLATRLRQATASGYIRAVVQQASGVRQLEIAAIDLTEMVDQPIYIIVDRVVSDRTPDQRVIESIETSMYAGEGAVAVFFEQTFEQTQGSETAGSVWEKRQFSRNLSCPKCEIEFPNLDASIFQSSHPAGACDQCQGKGQDNTASVCQTCGGSGFNRKTHPFQFGRMTIGQWFQLTAAEALTAVTDAVKHAAAPAATSILAQMQARLQFLNDVGLGYLQLNRSVTTMSAGERQRARFTSVLSSSLVNMLYVLDEPAMGLHRAEVGKLVSCIKKLHDQKNTIVVVDHTPEMLMAAERIVEIGPAAGTAGGQITFDGTAEELVTGDASLTGHYIAARRGLACRSDQRRPMRKSIRIAGASGNNLKNIDVTIPLGGLCAVAGVSGSGKSSLVLATLPGAIKGGENGDSDALPYRSISGTELIHDVVIVDGAPIGKTGRSNPVTYIKAFDDIRKVFAQTADAKSLGIKLGQFSFNVSGGRCQKCSGAGVIAIDMQFLPDVHVKCEGCGGTRYQPEVLQVRYRDKTIAEVLEMTVRDAFLFFRGQPKVQNKLKSLIDVGLEYIRLGQSALTLSSGESQRLKLALHLATGKSKRNLFVMDEPTTGLHMQDVTKLLDCFDSLITAGHSMVVIEHNLQLIKNADWVIDMGPGAGPAGGQVIAQGTPEDIAKCNNSVTGRYLKEALAASDAAVSSTV